MIRRRSETDPYWSQPAESLMAALDSRPSGLSAAVAQARLQEFGPNALEIKKRASGLELFLSQFKSPIVLMLLFATGVSALVKDWADVSIILAIILMSALLSFAQEYHASTAVEKLRAQVTISCAVLRDGSARSIPAEEAVPGDVVLLSAGTLIPADGVVLDANDLFVSQAVLTGETFPVEKHAGRVAAEAALAERTNCLFMGTSVRSGTGRCLIVQTGAATAYGRIAGRLARRAPETEFERGIRQFGYLLSEVMLLLVLAVFAINVFFNQPVIDSLLFSLALAVGLTPQLLPAIININLSRGSLAMAASGVIVRRMASLENFGSMDVLCTDKTGTLTEGVARLVAVLDARGEDAPEVLRYAYLNARFQTGLANPLDEAILSHDAPPLGGATRVDEIPYDFVRKRLGIVVQEGDERRLIVKGALDHVIEVCAQVRQDGAAVLLDEERRARIQERYIAASAEGYRVLGVATRTLPPRPGYTRADEQDLVFEGLLLFSDPPKPGVSDTIADLARLGVGLKIITGDNRLVALHTAREVGLELSGVVTGHEMHGVRDDALWHTVDRANLFVDVDPDQKESIIRALRRAGHVVGYMGDGINDAPALHAADVGISVEKATDVLKEAADIVLLRKELAVLHQGIVQGRTTFANTLKYIFMATSANFGNMFSVAGASLFLPFLPMLPKQILLLNFLTDLPEMTIAGDRVDPEWVQRPHRFDIRYIRHFMFVFGLLSSVFDYLTFAVFLWFLHADPPQFRTGWFVESVVSAAVVVFAVRTRLPFMRSRPSRAMLGVTAAVVLFTVAIPISPLAAPLGFEAPPPIYLLAVLFIVAAYFAFAEIAKRAFYRRLRG